MIAYGNRLEEDLDKLNEWNKKNNQGDSFFDKLGRGAALIGNIWLESKIIELYKKAAEAGNLDGYFHSGLFYLKKSNSKHAINEHASRLNAISDLTKGVEAGSVNCMWVLGLAWENVYNVLDGKNDSKYQNRLNKAPGNNNEERAANLALHWYKMAADNGMKEAQESYDEFLNKFQSNRSSGGGCFITTAVCDSFGKADDCYELTAFRNFRDKWLALQEDGKNLIAEYYSIAPNIVSKINQNKNSADIYRNIWKKYLKPCLNFIENGDNNSCKKLYIEMVSSLKKKFL